MFFKFRRVVFLEGAYMFPRCIAVDFDSTLAGFVGGKKELFDIFVRRGVAESEVKEAYEECKRNGGFAIQKLQKEIEKRAGKIFDSEPILQEFYEWVKKSVLAYPDSITAVSRWKVLHIPVVIVTFGDPDFQAKKISLTRVPHDKLHVVNAEDRKPAELRKLLEKYGKPVIFIDDKPLVLDSVREQGITVNEVITVLIRRRDGPYVDEKPKYHHYEISHLDQIDDIMRGEILT